MKTNSDQNKSSVHGNYSASHMKKGKDYDGRFLALPGRKLMWDLEKQVLTVLIEMVPQKNSYIDFAAGTGRILAEVAPHFNQSYALDISSQMLSIAQERYPIAEFVNADFRQYPDPLKDLQFDLFTAFRFFPNAEPELQENAMSYIGQHLKPDGFLIVNNHRTYGSITYRALRFARRLSKETGFQHSEMLQLAHKYSFKLVKAYSLGVVPQLEHKAILPWWFVGVLEKSNCRFGATSHRFGYNTIYLLKKQVDGKN